MCITSAEAVLSKTKLYSGEANFNDEYVHVIAYQNNAESLVSGPNAMILPIPSAKPLTPENMVDATESKGFLKTMESAFIVRRRSLSKGVDSLDLNACAGGYHYTFKTGSYTVALASSASLIPKALAAMPERIRPTISTQLLMSFARNYKGWPLAVCAWEGHVEAEPLVWWYEPADPTTLFAPALDSHTGGAPDVDAMVSVDHFVAFGSTINPVGVNTGAELNGDMQTLVSPRAIGKIIRGEYINGDFLCDIETMKSAKVRRQAPGGKRVEHFRFHGAG